MQNAKKHNMIQIKNPSTQIQKIRIFTTKLMIWIYHKNNCKLKFPLKKLLPFHKKTPMENEANQEISQQGSVLDENSVNQNSLNESYTFDEGLEKIGLLDLIENKDLDIINWV